MAVTAVAVRLDGGFLMITKPKIQLDVDKIRQLAAEGRSQRQIAALLGVCEDTLTARKQDTPAVAEALRDGYAESIVKVEDTLFKMATSGTCVAATIYWLKCRCPERWNDRQQIEVMSNTPVQIQIIDDLKD